MIEVTPAIADKINEYVNAAIDMNTALGKLTEDPQACPAAIEELHKALDKYLNRVSGLLHYGKEQ